YLDKIVPSMDLEIGRNLQKSLEKQGFSFVLDTKVMSATIDDNKVKVVINKDNQESVLEADIVLVSVGRKPYTENLGLENINMKLDSKGRIEVDQHFKTNIDNIYAIGDVIDGPMLAHKAEEEAVAVAEIIANQAGHVNYNTIPSVIYTWPEVASVGKTEEELKKENIDYTIGKFPFLANSRARATSEVDGMVKIIACKKSDKILGVHIIGPHAGTMIAEAVLAMEYNASSEDLARTTHAHPTLNEAVKEAALAVLGRAIHI
ncbi:MAG: dihydrolipoyl dehydrogenase, partial [Rickettsiales bacterium]